MSIHILTTDKRIVEQLNRLLKGSQKKHTFHTELEALIKTLPKLRKTDTVFYDLQLESSLWAFEAINYASKKTNLVAFEPITEGTNEKELNCPEDAEHYLLLSSDERKAKARLQKVLHEIAQKEAKRKQARKKPEPEALIPIEPTTNYSANRDEHPATITRYLKTKSPAMQKLLAEICEVSRKASLVFIEGEDGAEFELVAREINFRANGDQSPLAVVDPMHVNLDQREETANSDDRIRYCYLGLSYELTTLTLQRVNAYFGKIRNRQNTESQICLILGHISNSECYLEPAALSLIDQFRAIGQSIHIPNMVERREDISLIAQSVFTTMRVAHPFLLTRTLTSGAIQYLESQYKELNYSGLVRIIRNAIALTERDTLTEEELKSFSDDSPTTQHLVESLADEKYFKDQVGAA